MKLRYKYRLYPTLAQREALAKAFGCARVVFNDGLHMRKDAHEQGLPYVTDGDLSRRVITLAKRTPERAWLAEVSNCVLQQALADLNAGYRNFFNSIAGKRRGRKFLPPRFRSSKDNRQAIRFTRAARFSIDEAGRLRLPKIGLVRVRWSRELPSVPTSVTVIKDAAGRYFASFVVERTEPEWPQALPELGLDFGLTHFITGSDGSKIDAPRFLRGSERKLRRLQKGFDRKESGSKRRNMARVRVARAHAKVADTRRDWLHKLSTNIVRENQAIYVEDLSIRGLARTGFARSALDAGWHGFTEMLGYKSERAGRRFGKVDRWFPSSRMCGECGRLGEKKRLNVRKWECPCGALHDRDVNAARNVLAAGRADSNDRGDGVRPRSSVAAVDEAVTRWGLISK